MAMDNALHRLSKGILTLILSVPALAFAAKPDCLPVKITPNGSLPTATVGAPYSATLSATEGVANIVNPSFTVTRGTLPANITLSSAGAFGGSATAAGDTPVRITVVNLDTGCSGSREYVLHAIVVDHVPTFTAGGDQTVFEDAGAQSVPGWATNINDNDGNTQTLNFVVTNNSNPSLFSGVVAVSPTGTLTYTPAANAFGSANITVELHDSGASNNVSTPVTFAINVTGVNDAPSFIKGADESPLQDSGLHTVTTWATAISDGPNETGQMLNFIVTNDNNALFSVQPAVSPSGTLTYTLAAGQSGTAVVSVSLHDDGGVLNGGVDTSAVQTFNIVVNFVNHVPTFTPGSNVSVNEDSSAYSAAWASAIDDGDAGVTQTLNFIVGNNNNALFAAQPAIDASGVLTFTPAANANGTATVSVQLHDNGGTANGGVDTTTPAVTFTITVTAVNDAPSFTTGGNVSVNEDSGAYSAAWATAISPGPTDESGQVVDFIVSNNNNALFSAQPTISATGVLSFTPAANAFGSATVQVQLHDDGGVLNGGVDTSTPAVTFTITVNQVNQVPSFTAGGNVTVNEDSGAYSAGWATAISDGDGNTQTLNFIVGNDNNALFSAQPAISPTGVLTFTPAANANGSATVSVQLHDNGGTANGGVDTSTPAVTFTITVNSVNDVPSFTGGGNVTVNEDSGAYSAGWATAISPGPANESGQVVNFIVGNNNNALFSAQPAISATGVLTFTPVANANGTATVSVQLHDDGGTVNGGVDTTTPAVTFVLTVTAVNDPPVNTVPTSASLSTAFSNTPMTISGVSIADIDAGVGTMTVKIDTTSGGATFSLAGGATVSAGVNGSSTVTLSGTQTQLNAALATLSYKSNDGFTGADTMQFLTNDGGNTGTGGPLTDTDSFQIGVVPQTFIIDNTDGTADSASAGTAANPFNSIANFNTFANDGVGDYIYVKNGTGTYSEANGFTLLNNQQLYGQGQTLQFTNPVTSAVVTIGTGAAGTTPTVSITGAGQTAVALAQGNTLTGFNVATTLASQTGIADGGGTVGALTVNDVDVSGTGMAVDIDQGGTLNVALGTLSSSGSSQQGVQLAGTALSGSFSATAGAISGSTGTGFLVGDGLGTANTGGTVTITYPGTITTTGTARTLDIQDRSAGAGTLTFSGNLSHSAGNANGIFIDDVAAGAISLSGANTLNTGTAAAISATDITGGSLTLSGTQDIDTTSGIGISLGTNSVATSFSGSQITVNTTSGAGISIASNSGTVSFANAGNGLDVVTTAGGTGISASSSGALSITGTSNTIASTNGTALSVVNTNIAAAGLNFVSIASNGGANNGVVLDTTGTAGGLTVTGTGVADSGGIIQNKTGANGTTQGIGMYLNVTSGVSLDRMRFSSFSNYAIRGKSVTGFKLDNSTVTGGSGDTNAGGAEEDAIRFDGLFTSAAYPTAQISNSAIDGGYTNNLRVLNTSGTLNRLMLTNLTFGLINGTGGNDSVNVYAVPAGATPATLNVTLQNSTFAGTRGDFFETIADGNSTMDVVARQNKFTNGQTIIPGGGVALSVRGDVVGTSDAVTFDLSCNRIVGGHEATGIFVAKGNGNGTWNGTIVNNPIGAAAGAGGDGIFVRAAGGGTISMLMRDNTVTGYGNVGYHLQNNDGSSTMNAALFNNLVTAPHANGFAGLFVDNGATATDTSKANVVVGSAAVGGDKNDFSAGDPFNFSDVSLSNFNASTTFSLSRNGSANSTAAQIIDDDNTNPANTNTDTSGGAGTITAVNTLPSVPAAPAGCVVPP